MTLSLRTTIQLSIFTIITFIVLAYLHLTGILVAPPQDKITFIAWLINILLIAVVAAVIILVHLKFNNAYSNVISDLEESNRIISEKERNYREIFNSSTDAIFIHDLDGRILDVNDSMLEMYGYEYNDLPSITVNMLSSLKEGFQQIDILRYFQKVIENNPQVFDWQAKNKNGDIFWVEVSLKKTIIGENDRILAIVRNINDKKEDEIQLNHYRNHLEELVTSRTEELRMKNLELNTINIELNATMDNLKEAQTQLIQTEKMASLGLLTAGVAHEINNPINYIYNGAAAIELILGEKDHETLNQLKPYTEAINIGIKRISDIVKSLSKYSRSEKTPFSNCNLHEVIDDCLIMLNNQYKNRIEIEKHYSLDPVLVYANEGQLHQAFLNILTNAVQAISDKGTIIIKTYIEDNIVNASFADTGIGILENNLNSIFDPFFTTKAPGEGTGLGLAITKRIINSHNGTITCNSILKKGTTFLIQLPLTSN
jgi:PAS domain S-box-containing protein